MPSFEDALRSLNTLDMDKEADSNLNSIFLNNRMSWVNEIVTGYLKYNTNPNDTISKIAAANKLNGDQIQRLVEEVNVGIYLDKYAGTKNQKVRRVEFDLADPQKVTAIEAVASVQKVNFEMEKAASADEPSAYNAFTMDSGRYEPSMWEKEPMQKAAAEMLKRKLNIRIADERRETIGRLQETLAKIAYVADALIYNERAEGTAQELFEKIASEAGCDARTKTGIINMTDKHTKLLRGMNKLPGNFQMKLAMTEQPVNEFSLGKHSISKQANDEYVVKARHLPDQVTYERLVEVAREIRQELDKHEPGTEVKLRVVE